VFRLLAHISGVSLSLSHVTRGNRSDGTTPRSCTPWCGTAIVRN